MRNTAEESSLSKSGFQNCHSYYNQLQVLDPLSVRRNRSTLADTQNWPIRGGGRGWHPHMRSSFTSSSPFKRQAESYRSSPCRKGLNTLWKVALKSDSLPGMGSTMRNRARVCKGSCLPPSEVGQPSLSELSDCKPRNHGNDYLHFIKQTHRRFRELDCLPSIATLFKLPINLDTFCYFILL